MGGQSGRACAIDLGVVQAPVNNKNLVVDECRRDKLVAIVPPGHPKADLKKITLDELLEYPFICREEGSGTREVINEYMNNSANCQACMNIAMELGSPEAVKGAVEAGMGISIVNEICLTGKEKLAVIPLEDYFPRRTYGAVTRKGKFLTPQSEAFLEAMATLQCKLPYKLAVAHSREQGIDPNELDPRHMPKNIVDLD